MKKFSWMIILGTLLLFLGVFNHGVFKKEQLMDQGRLILMELAPVDPRSLIQGDYVRLEYALGRSMAADSPSASGLAALEIDGMGVARSIRTIASLEELRIGELPIKYSKRSRRGIQIGAESYFFQEGKAEKYEKAKYGGIKLDPKGNSLLIGLYDESFQKIE